jgi:hypothetical protein
VSLPRDLLGRSLSPVEAQVLETYRGVLALLKEPLPPSVDANLREAAAALWQIVNDLALADERPDL